MTSEPESEEVTKKVMIKKTVTRETSDDRGGCS
jgi:hypothetical protein